MLDQMTISKVPNHEMYEEGGQIRRSIKSVKSTIASIQNRVSSNQNHSYLSA